PSASPPPLHPFPTRRSSDLAHVEFTYDPLGRRIGKRYLGKLTRWVWDGQVPLHEWVEDLRSDAAPEPEDLPDLEPHGDDERDVRSEEHTSEFQSRENLVCRL